jgi:hypothetical protein
MTAGISTLRGATPELHFRYELIALAGVADTDGLRVLLAGSDAEAITLDLVQNWLPEGSLSICRKARRDEPGRKGTLQHAD